MIDLDTVRVLLEYTDWSNRQLLECAAGVDDAALDRDLQIGPGSLRRILLHIYNGEHAWLRRWKGEAETKWPSEGEKVGVPELASRFAHNAEARDAWLRTVSPSDVGLAQTYRDSKGSLFRASLGDMLVQGVVHSKHHQAQAVNALKRLGAKWPELDYMYRVRVAAE
jgi:uncharacterized damage-inducible protein DinB